MLVPSYSSNGSGKCQQLLGKWWKERGQNREAGNTPVNRPGGYRLKPELEAQLQIVDRTHPRLCGALGTEHGCIHGKPVQVQPQTR
jgi:hypothetical protein